MGSAVQFRSLALEVDNWQDSLQSLLYKGQWQVTIEEKELRFDILDLMFASELAARQFYLQTKVPALELRIIPNKEKLLLPTDLYTNAERN